MSVDSSDVMTTEDLRNRLFNLLRNKGLVGKLQSQLRNHLVVELKGVGLSQPLGAGRADPGGVASLPLRAVNSLVADHLKHAGYDYSLSIFLPESGMAQDKVLTTKDLLQLLRISSQSKLHRTLTDASVSDSGFLWLLVKEISAFNSRPTIENGTQTEFSRMPSTSIEEEFRKVDAYYSSLEGGGTSRVASVEERILAYQRLVEERSRSDLQMEIARYKDNELARLRIEERENSRKEIEKSRREMEQTYRAKYDGLRERERNFSESMQKHQELIEKENFAQRQTILEEIDAVKQREAQLRRQQEINNRERSLAEERLKSLEEMAKRREDSARRAELEIEQRIRNEVEKFKVEEQARYLERLKNLEFREDKVKDNERRVGDELQEITHTKVELREKRGKVTELEAELIRVRHDLISAQKHNEMFSERAREMADYQNMKEDNAVLRRELDNAKIRIAELTRDVMVERQKHEDILRELGHVASKPTSEVALLRKQIEQLHLSLRTERSLADHTKLQMEQRLETEMDRNKQLLTKYQEQSWKQKEINWETRDLREQLLGRERALHMRLDGEELSRSDSPCELIDGRPRAHLPKLGDSSLHQHIIDPHLLFDSPSCVSLDHQSPTHSEDGSFSSDLIRDTKNRLKRIDRETEKLEKWYQDCHMRAVSIAPVLGPEPSSTGSREVTPKAKTVAFSRQESDPVQFSSQPSHFRAEPKRSAYISEIDASASYFANESGSKSNTVTREPVYASESKESTKDRVDASGGRSRHFGFQQPERKGADFWEESRSEDIGEMAKTTGAVKSPVTESSSKTSLSAKLQKETEEEERRKETERFEEERRLRMEERQRKEEEAWRREQEELEELQRQEKSRASTDGKQSNKNTKIEQEETSEVDDVSKNSELDPELQKYMAIVQKKREEEKEKAKQVAPVASQHKEVEDESVATSDEMSAPDNKSDIQASVDDDW